MDKLKALLLPLAIALGVILAFESGVRYGAANMRAHAIADQIELSLAMYTRAHSTRNAAAAADLEQVLDNVIAAGALHRTVWYLAPKAHTAIDESLSKAFAVRGDKVEHKLAAAEASENLPETQQAQLEKIRTAVHDAKRELTETAEVNTPAEAGTATHE